MKKTIMAAMCCFALSFSVALAQDDSEFQPDQRGMRGGHFEPQMVDTAITNHMELTPDQLVQIADLNTTAKEQMTAKMGKKDENGKKLSKEERKARMDEIKLIKSDARKQLRTILGDEKYIEYLEKSLDSQPMMGGPRGGMQGRSQQMPQRGGRGGGFGGDFSGFSPF